MSDERYSVSDKGLRWDDLQVQIDSAKLPASQAAVPTLISSISGAPAVYGYALAFTSGFYTYAYFTVQIPHSWYEECAVRGAYIRPHIHYFTGDTLSGTAVWSFRFSWSNVGEVIPASTRITSNLVFNGTQTPFEHTVHQLGELDPTAYGEKKKISSILTCELSRNGTSGGNTYAGDLYVMAIDFHLIKDTNGSIGEYKKYKNV